MVSSILGFVISVLQIIISTGVPVSSSVTGPQGTYSYKAPISGVMDVNIRLANGTAQFEIFFHYNAQRSRGGAYCDLMYFSSPVIPYLFNTSESRIYLNISTGSEFERDTSTMFSNLYKWTYDYYPGLTNPTSVIKPTFGQPIVYSNDSDTLSIPLLIGVGQFKRDNETVDLKREFEFYEAYGGFMHPLFLERQPFRYPVAATQQATYVKSYSEPKRVATLFNYMTIMWLAASAV